MMSDSRRVMLPRARRDLRRGSDRDVNSAAGAAPALDDGLLDLEQLDDRRSMSPSSTSSTSATCARMIGSVSAPGSFTAIPSAMVEPAKAAARPCKAQCTAGKPLVSTPTISMPGFSAFAATAMPAIIPPPPTGTTSVSRRAAVASISSAIVPWPAMTSGSSYGCTSVAPRSLAVSSPARRASSKVSPEDHLGAESARALDLHVRREARHDDRRPMPRRSA
jgi:hypothetical protein